jgi:hypothetical protein
LNFLGRFSNNVMKICPVGAELLHVDGRADRDDKANIHVSQFFKHA